MICSVWRILILVSWWTLAWFWWFIPTIITFWAISFSSVPFNKSFIPSKSICSSPLFAVEVYTFDLDILLFFFLLGDWCSDISGFLETVTPSELFFEVFSEVVSSYNNFHFFLKLHNRFFNLNASASHNMSIDIPFYLLKSLFNVLDNPCKLPRFVLSFIQLFFSSFKFSPENSNLIKLLFVTLFIFWAILP